MLDNTSALTQGIAIRPARSSDEAFLSGLYRSARPDLQLIDEETEFVDQLVQQQQQVMQSGIGAAYPNAMHYVIEKLDTRIGSLVVDFGHNEVRVLYLAFVPAARGLGFGRSVLQGVQQAARQVNRPVAAVVWRSNLQARSHYLSLGFQLEEASNVAERLVWYPAAE
ncbi:MULTISPECIES: GNAT family N-acetyltransferase [unclassified Pseudomonas]|uniref:GNAT family N-acetyltransferase n=1 Tax=unclassified Pseudomonas TaxID=196821 RepID=UPI00244A0D1F|nr:MULTISPECIES: GNAT family N-acetyltransferase [unclassified Pseudomonas]MDH0897656.1 GNAT family N-acetyltransferase [Pseudomonas sp. GD03875]MDH1067739.1 GNAT family N-acetyltransferase [Pseudomonas sp. GD03985]